jgi:hypothetical protein
MFSPEILQAVQQERMSDAQREAQRRQFARLAQENRSTNRGNWFSRLFAKPVAPVVEVAHQTAELVRLTTQEIRKVELRAEMYERIAQGNALVEAEAYADGLRSGQLPC